MPTKTRHLLIFGAMLALGACTTGAPTEPAALPADLASREESKSPPGPGSPAGPASRSVISLPGS